MKVCDIDTVTVRLWFWAVCNNMKTPFMSLFHQNFSVSPLLSLCFSLCLSRSLSFTRLFFSCGVHCKFNTLLFLFLFCWNILNLKLFYICCSSDENFWFWSVIVRLCFWILSVVLKEFQYAFRSCWVFMCLVCLSRSLSLSTLFDSRFFWSFGLHWKFRMLLFSYIVFHSISFVAFLLLKRWHFAILTTY